MNNNIVYMTSKMEMADASAYAFLSQPPPQKRRPTQPLTSPPQCQLPPTPVKPTRSGRRSSFTATISAWASHVQPGSPAPASPHRRLSIKGRPSNFTAGIGHARVPSSPFITPTPTTASHKTFDFTTVGYNTVFVHMPKTPETPSPLLRAKAQKDQELYQEKKREKAVAKEESKEKRGKIIKKIKSLTQLRPRAKSVSKDAAIPNAPLSPLALVSPSYTTATAPMPSKASKSKSKANKPKKTSSVKSKKAIYGPLVRAVPTLSNELALMQFADGGKMEDHIKRVMTTESGAVGDVYRDGKGGVWWDREEELEYRGLLVDAESSEDDADSNEKENERAVSWVKFEGQTHNDAPLSAFVKATEQPSTDIRRGSASSASTFDSDLDPAYLMQTDDAPAYHDERVLNFDLRASSKAPASLKANNAAIKPGPMLLSLPARPFRAAKHLRKPEFMVDMQAFGLAMSNAAAEGAAVSSKLISPRSPLFPLNLGNAANSMVSRRRARKIPAPLKIAPGMSKMRKVVAVSSPGSAVPPLTAGAAAAHGRSIAATLAPSLPMVVDAQHLQQIIREGKREFMQDSFQPEVSKFDDDSEYDFVEEPTRQVADHGMKKRASRLDLRGIFGGSRKE